MCEENIQLACNLVAAWNAHDVSCVEAFYDIDYEGEDVAEISPLRGPVGMSHFMTANLQAFPDLHLTVEQCVAQGDAVALFWIANGTHLGRVMNIPPTGRHIEMRGASWLKVNNHKIVNGLQVWDVAGMLRAIGLLPDLLN